MGQAFMSAPSSPLGGVWGPFYESDAIFLNPNDTAEYTLDFTVTDGVENLSGGDETALDDAIFDSDNSLDLAQIVDLLDFDAPAGSTYNGTSGNDVLAGGTGDDQVNGVNGDDTLNGGLGADTINGGNGNDTMNGQGGDDVLLGGNDVDTYVYEAGHGNDVYEEAGFGGSDLADRVLFGAGIDIGDLTITRVSNKDLLIEIDNGVVTGSILLQDQFNDSGSIDYLEFNDTSTYDLTAQSYTLTGSGGNDTLRGVEDTMSSGIDTIYGGDGNDTIYGYNTSADSYANTLYGGDGNDIIWGANGVDTIDGGAGNDELDGGSGNDDITMGSGDDEARGDGGDDTFRFVSGNDLIADSSGTDVLRLDAAWNSNTPDYYRIGNDLKIVFDDNNSIRITNHYSGSNAVESMVYADTTSVNLTTVTYVVQGDDSNNTLTGGSGADTFFGFGGNHTMTGNGGNDLMYGGTGDDTINGNAGDDYIEGGAGSDTMNGGADNDEYLYVSGNDIITETSGGTDLLELVAGWAWGDLTFRRYDADESDLVILINGSNSITINGHFGSGDAMETLRLNDGTGDVTLTSMQYESHGDSGNNTINGITVNGSTNDIMYGFGGADTLNGDAGDDDLYGGDDNDTLNGGANADMLDGGAGDDDLNGSSGDDHYVYASGHDVITDTNDTDILELDASIAWGDLAFRRYVADLTDLVIEIDGSNSITINQQFFSSAKAIETLRVDGTGDVTLTSMQFETHGTSGNNTLNGITAGGSTNDIMYGLGGNDTLNGDAGNDYLDGGSGDDTLNGSSGDDTYIYSGGLDTATDTGGTDVLHITGVTVNDIAFSSVSTHNTKITVTASVDELTITNLRNPNASHHIETILFDDGFYANLPSYQTWMNGTSGNDSSNGDGNANTMIGFAGDDTIDGLAGNDAIHGGSGNDSIEGGDGADLLHGGVGNDTLYGEDGLDVLFGGAGADTFMFQAASAFNNVDEVRDFSTAESDVLDIANLLSGYDEMTDLITDFVEITTSGANSILKVDADGGANNFVQIATLYGVTGLTDEESLETSGYLNAA